MPAAALRAEAGAFADRYSVKVLPDGHQRVARQGYGSERPIQTGVGADLDRAGLAMRVTSARSPF